MLLAALAVGGAGCFRVGKDASTLRRSVAQALSTDLDPKFEFSVGGLTLGLVRGGLALAEVDMPPEARAGLGAFHAAEVGVYTLHRGEDAMNPAQVLSTTDEAMRRRGWDRMVGVVDHDNLVAVYVPAKIGKGTTLRACVLVIGGRDVVVASAQGDPAQVVALAMDHARKEHPELGHRAF